jgi:hypothetical protein
MKNNYSFNLRSLSGEGSTRSLSGEGSTRSLSEEGKNQNEKNSSLNERNEVAFAILHSKFSNLFTELRRGINSQL